MQECQCVITPSATEIVKRGAEAARDFQELEGKDAEGILQWTFVKFHPRLALASSFGAEDVVLIDMLHKINPEARVFTLDTGRLPQETYDLMDSIRHRYNMNLEVYFPDTKAVEQMVNEHGVNLFHRRVEFRKLCCKIRKVEPLNRALEGLDAWITGLRREQAETRNAINKVEVDLQHKGILKINPLADWSWERVWEYIESSNVPYNALHDKGYPSIGCAPCTRAVKPGEDLRAGRWWWEQDGERECGLHCDPAKKVIRGY